VPDAFAAAVTGLESGVQLATVPPAPQTDGMGLPMEIVHLPSKIIGPGAASWFIAQEKLIIAEQNKLNSTRQNKLTMI